MEAPPLGGDLADGAGHELRVDSPLGQQRQDRIQFTVPYERFAADDRNVKRPVAIDQRHDAVDELLPFEIPELAQREIAAKVIVAVRVTPGTTQRALAGDLDGHRGSVAGKDAAPRGNNALQSFHSHTIAASVTIPHPR